MALTQPIATVATGLLAVLVGLIALTGVLPTLLRAEKQFAETHALARDRALRTCVDQMAHDKHSIRQAGAHALAALADDWLNDPVRGAPLVERHDRVGPTPLVNFC
ncbi:hypothetical protein [Nocardia sp. NPDC052566]|uniref:hypothetical protein n=1 Tax=Nocardia sp. NPDC052566 TaxID=3364330 RepID=UPI0037CC74D7